MALLKDKIAQVLADGMGHIVSPPIAVSRPSLVSEPLQYQGVGLLLRQQRERLGFDLNTVCAQLRIRIRYLHALEAGEFSVLPGHIYVVGFLKSYSDFLGLDAGAIVMAYQTEGRDLINKNRLVFPIPAPETHRPKIWLVTLSLIFAGLVYTGWYFAAMREHPQVSSVPPVPERMLEQAPLTIDPAKNENKLRDVAVVPPVDTQVTEPTPTITVITPPPVEVVAALPPEPAALPPSRVTFRFTADSWIDIRSTSNEIIFPSKIFHAGETYIMPDRTDLILWTGNLGGIEFTIDGRVIGRLGASGEPKRNLSLDPERLLALTARQHQ